MSVGSFGRLLPVFAFHICSLKILYTPPHKLPQNMKSINKILTI